MNRVAAVVRMHLARHFSTFAMPVFLTVGVVVALIIITLAIRAAGVDTTSEEFVTGMGNNGGVAYSLLGFLIALGVQAANASFAFATSLGVTRRHYVAGTAIYFVVQSAILTALMALLLILEKLTNHWFIGARAMDVFILGSGSWGRFLLIVFLGVLTSLSLGALFGASWLRFGSRGPLIISGVLVVIIAAALFLLIPRFAQVMAAASFSWVPLIMIALTLVSFLGAAVFLRRATVRGA